MSLEFWLACSLIVASNRALVVATRFISSAVRVMAYGLDYHVDSFFHLLVLIVLNIGGAMKSDLLCCRFAEVFDVVGSLFEVILLGMGPLLGEDLSFVFPIVHDLGFE